ncbi:MAG: Ig-like domain-containing protein [Cyclobacteriaceae bacterium]|jgi:hypothetical protein|nr:Ig-like domain-containing protein [Cyclobacteriaceae bacterium]
MKKILNYLFLIPITFWLFQCAKQTQPTGGPKDETPPKLIQSNPPDRTINFQGNEIELLFDEPIQVNNPREQLLATPAIGKKFEMTARKNKAVLKLNTVLLPNTTYTISFRESIQDLSEKNSAQNLKIAFSTGSYIDSLSISGNVFAILDGSPVKNYVVAAVIYNDTIDIFKHEASWITFTDEKGNFTLENLKPEAYILYAFEDKNKNLIVDSKSELYGFIAETVKLDSSIKDIRIPVAKLDARPLKLISAKSLTAYFNIRFSKGLDRYTLTPSDSSQKIISIQEDPATIKVFNTIRSSDSIRVSLQAYDSINNQVDTAIYIKFEQRETPKDKFIAKSEEVKFYQGKGLLETTLTFSKPIVSYSIDSIFIQLDSSNFIRILPSEISWEQNYTVATIKKNIPKEITFTKPQTTTTPGSGGRRTNQNENNAPKKKTVFNQLIIPKGTFISVESDSNQYSQISINTLTNENTGILSIQIVSKNQTITEVLSSKKTEQQSTDKKISFDYLLPAEYRVRTIIDLNNNGRWDPGNFYKRIPPEPILYYLNEKGQMSIQLKANWEIGPLLITDE